MECLHSSVSQREFQGQVASMVLGIERHPHLFEGVLSVPGCVLAIVTVKHAVEGVGPVCCV